MPLGSTSEARPSSVVVLGADMVLAALPATPVQLAHACRALGYDVAFPASWGDEVVANACLDRLHEFGNGPAILCSCPLVTERLTKSGDELAPFMMNLVAPPVAAARYLRALYGERPVRITYAGSCPSAADPAIDACIAPAELLLAFEERGIVLAAQPEYFESVLPPDRRRYESLPGGVPSPERIHEVDPGRTLAELDCSDDEIALEIAQRLIAHERELIDIAPRVGCACSGALAVGASSAARTRLTALEPPRAHSPVLDPSIRVDADLPSLAEPAGAPRWGRTRSQPVTVQTDPDAVGAQAIARDDGALIPRAFAARLRRVSSTDRSTVRNEPDTRGPSGTTADGARRPRRITRPVVIPLSSEMPRVVPPPPARPRPGIDDPDIAVGSDL
jgi:hypothetical protein